MTDKGKKIHIRLPEEVHKKLKVKCAYEDTSVQEFVERLIKESVAKYSVLETLEKAGLPTAQKTGKTVGKTEPEGNSSGRHQ